MTSNLIQVDTYHDNRLVPKNFLYTIELAELDKDAASCEVVHHFYPGEVDFQLDSFNARISIFFNWLIENYSLINEHQIYVVTNDNFITSLIKQVNAVTKLISTSPLLKKKQLELSPIEFTRYVLLEYGVVKKTSKYLDSYVEVQSKFIQQCTGNSVKELLEIPTPTFKKRYKLPVEQGGYTELEKAMYRQHMSVCTNTLRIGDNKLNITEEEINAEIKHKFANRKNKKRRTGQ